MEINASRQRHGNRDKYKDKDKDIQEESLPVYKCKYSVQQWIYIRVFQKRHFVKKKMCTPPRNWWVPWKIISRRRAPKNKSRGSLLTLEVGQIWPGSGSVFYQLMVLVSLHYSMLYYRGKVLSRDKIWWQGGGRSSAMWQADPPSEETRGNSVKICMNRMLGRMYQWNCLEGTRSPSCSNLEVEFAADSKNIFFLTPITLEPRVPHRWDASQNDRKNEGFAFKTSKAALVMQNSDSAAAADSATVKLYPNFKCQ